MPRRIGLSLSVLAIVSWSSIVAAQELTPRAYWPSPRGTNVLVVAYQYSSGDVVTDPTLPIAGVESEISYLQLTYQRSLSLFRRSANLQLSLPHTQSETAGILGGAYQSRKLSGMGDARATVSINLRGAPSMDAAAFQELRREPRTIIGVGLTVQAPTGEYDADKLINIGANRWAMKPALGFIWPLAPKWLLEFDAGLWLFGDNDDFVGTTREQRPILSTELHLVKRIRPGFWAALDANYYVGGETVVDGSTSVDLQRNSRLGATFLVPLKGKHAIRGSYSTGIVTDSWGDYQTFSLSYLCAWQ